MVTNRSGGFTLVEITIVLAITAGLAIIAFTTQAGLQGQARFKDSIEHIVSELDSVRNTASITVNEDPNATGVDTSRVVFGKLVEIMHGSTKMTVTDMIGTNANQIDNPESQILSRGASFSIVFPWGVTYVGPNLSLAYHRLINNGDLAIYQIDSNHSPLPGGPNPLYIYSENPGLGPLVQLDFIDPDGRKASVFVDGAHGAAVNRQYK